MAYITTEEAKLFLRVDSTYEDALIASIISSGESICRSVARLDETDWELVGDAETATEDVEINGILHTPAMLVRLKNQLLGGIRYAVGYLYEHREDANMDELTRNLSRILFIREGFF